MPRSPALVLIATLVLATSAVARPDDTSLASYLPEASYDPDVPAPRDVLGWEVGEWHVRHDQLVQYMRALAEASPRVSIETYAHSHEQRPLVLLTITSPENHARLDELREAHLEAVTAGRDRGPDAPVIVQLGYSVHGNEASAGNASLLVAYHLAAADDPGVDLSSTIVLLDPCLNPDGFARFASWVNQHRGRVLVPDAAHREHREVWPGGRTNHYWFDLNRDWLLLTHPESRGRVRQFQRWRPHVLTDGHEMGTESTYFFQPGVPTRQNPRTPARNLALTRAIAERHAEALDDLGTLYYSEERFDDFYYGKGSTYPDVHGSIGILFEQASSRGHLQENSSGALSFPDTIRNQVATSFSTLRAAAELRDELLAHQVETVRGARSQARDDSVRGYVFGHPRDHSRTTEMARILRAHRITLHELDEAITVAGTTFEPGAAFVVPCDQPQYLLVKSLFETRTEFEDDTFYDVSTWTLPLAFAMPHAELTSLDGVGDVSDSITSERLVAGEAPYAFAFEWHELTAPRGLQHLLDAGVRARVVTQPVEMVTTSGPRAFDAGTVIVPLGIQDGPVRAELRRLVTKAADLGGFDLHAIATGLTPAGVDLGSPSVYAVEPPRPIVLVGPGVSAYEAGEVWHALDLRFGVATTLVELDDLDDVDLHDFTHLVMVNGSYGAISDATTDAVRAWVADGGVVIAQKSATSWAERHLVPNRASSDARPDAPDDDVPAASRRPYAEYDDARSVDVIGGAIFAVDVDLTHPLAFGYTQASIPVFRNSTRTLDTDRDPFSMPFVYRDEPLLSGYASDDNVAAIGGTPAVIANRLGAGLVVRFADVPNFRGVFRGTEKLFANAIYMSGAVRRTGPTDEAHEEALDSHGHPDHH